MRVTAEQLQVPVRAAERGALLGFLSRLIRFHLELEPYAHSPIDNNFRLPLCLQMAREEKLMAEFRAMLAAQQQQQ